MSASLTKYIALIGLTAFKTKLASHKFCFVHSFFIARQLDKVIKWNGPHKSHTHPMKNRCLQNVSGTMLRFITTSLLFASNDMYLSFGTMAFVHHLPVEPINLASLLLFFFCVIISRGTILIGISIKENFNKLISVIRLFCATTRIFALKMASHENAKRKKSDQK